jgi:hypothetical protein
MQLLPRFTPYLNHLLKTYLYAGKGSLFVLALLAITTLNFGIPGSPSDKLTELYHKADSLLNLPEPTDISNREALAGFESVISKLEKNRSATTHCFSYVTGTRGY